MIYGAYAIFDKKALVFSQPFYCPNDSVAVRIVRGMVNGNGTAIAQSPEDFTLHYLGSFDDNKGVFNLPTETVVIGNAIQLKEKSDVQRANS